jgi:hypothetical protein
MRDSQSTIRPGAYLHPSNFRSFLGYPVGYRMACGSSLGYPSARFSRSSSRLESRFYPLPEFPTSLGVPLTRPDSRLPVLVPHSNRLSF